MSRSPMFHMLVGIAAVVCLSGNRAWAQLGFQGHGKSSHSQTGLETPKSISGKIADVGKVFIVVENEDEARMVPIDGLTFVVIHGATDLSCLRPGLRIEVQGVLDEARNIVHADAIKSIVFNTRNGQHNAVRSQIEHNAWWDTKPENEVRIKRNGITVHATMIGKITGLNPLRVTAQNRMYGVQITATTRVNYEMLVDDPRGSCSLGDRVSVRFQRPTRANYYPAAWFDITKSNADSRRAAKADEGKAPKKK